MPYVRTAKTASGATAAQLVYSCHRGSRQIDQLGSAHDPAELELLKAAARQKLAAGQGGLDLGLYAGAPSGPLPITSSRMGCPLDALSHAYSAAPGASLRSRRAGHPLRSGFAGHPLRSGFARHPLRRVFAFRLIGGFHRRRVRVQSAGR